MQREHHARRAGWRAGWLLALPLAGCASPAGWSSVVEVGEVAIDNGQPVIAAPSSGSVDSPVSITVSTVGGGCVSLDSTKVASAEDGGEITPYDRREIPPPGAGCTLELVYLPHQASLTFSTPGTKNVVVHLRRATPSGLEPFDAQLAIAIQ